MVKHQAGLAMRLTNADVDQWLSELVETLPVALLADGQLDHHVLGMVNDLAAEASDPRYVFRAVQSVFPQLKSMR